jgi:hypothetical protein
MKRVLIVDDDVELCESITEYCPFLKIFVWFWIVQILIGAVMFTLTTALRFEPDMRREHPETAFALNLIAQSQARITARRIHQTHDVFGHVALAMNLLDARLQAAQPRAIEYSIQSLQRMTFVLALHDFDFVIQIGITQCQSHRKAFHLRFGQRMSAVKSDGFCVAMTKMSAAPIGFALQLKPDLRSSLRATLTECADLCD